MISIGLNLILGVLLFCALVMGARLERRLRVLRQSQLDFAKAVSELDKAAGRTESSLASLQAGSDAARTDLAARIDQARIACQRLEKLTADADRVLNQPLALAQPISSPAKVKPPSLESLDRAAEDRSRGAFPQTAFARPEPARPRPAPPAQARPALAAVPPPAQAQTGAWRPRGWADDDLFDTGPAPERRPVHAAAMGARR